MKNIFLTLFIFQLNFDGSRFLKTFLLFTLLRTFQFRTFLNFCFCWHFWELLSVNKYIIEFTIFGRFLQKILNIFLTNVKNQREKNYKKSAENYLKICPSSAKKTSRLIKKSNLIYSVEIDLIFASIFLHFCWSDSRKQHENVAFVNWQFVFEKL